jgi:hypothetical protein
LVKKGKNWLIGIKKVKVPIEAFPNLEEKIKAIKHHRIENDKIKRAD